MWPIKRGSWISTVQFWLCFIYLLLSCNHSFLCFLCFLPAACLFANTWEFCFYKVFTVFALRHIFKYLKHFGFLMFEVNTVLLCYVQLLNIYSISISKYLELKSHSPKRAVFNTGRLGLSIKCLHKWTWGSENSLLPRQQLKSVQISLMPRWAVFRYCAT